MYATVADPTEAFWQLLNFFIVGNLTKIMNIITRPGGYFVSWTEVASTSKLLFFVGVEE